MIERFLAAAFLIAPIIFGYIGSIRNIRRNIENHNKTVEFIDNFNKWINDSSDSISGHYVIKNSMEIQGILGSLGIFSNYSPPYASYSIRNYQLIINHVIHIRDLLVKDKMGLWNDQINSMAIHVNDAISRYWGLSERLEAEAKGGLRNPIKMYTSGIRMIISYPVKLLSEFGLLGESILRIVLNSSLFRFVSGTFSLVAFIATCMTIILGWSEFKSVLLGAFG